MQQFEPTDYLSLAVVAILGLYAAARLITAAFYKSKADYEERSQRNGTPPKPKHEGR